MFPDSPVFNTANSSAVKYPFQNYLSKSLPKNLLGFSVVLVFSQDPVRFFSVAMGGWSLRPCGRAWVAILYHTHHGWEAEVRVSHF